MGYWLIALEIHTKLYRSIYIYAQIKNLVTGWLGGGYGCLMLYCYQCTADCLYCGLSFSKFIMRYMLHWHGYNLRLAEIKMAIYGFGCYLFLLWWQGKCSDVAVSVAIYVSLDLALHWLCSGHLCCVPWLHGYVH